MGLIQRPIEDLPRLYKSLTEKYGTDEGCRQRLKALVWPHGFRCRRCRSHRCHHIRTRDLYECAECKTQHSLTAGLPMHGARLPLPKWFAILFFIITDSTRDELKEEAARLRLSERTLRRWLRKLDGRWDRELRCFQLAFLYDLKRPERTSTPAEP